MSAEGAHMAKRAPIRTLGNAKLSRLSFSSLCLLPVGVVTDSDVQMLERMKQQQKEMEGSMQEQRQQLQADQDDLASWKADAQHQLDMQQVCLHACLLSHKAHHKKSFSP